MRDDAREDYRDWMLENIDDMLLNNSSESVDDIVERMKDDDVSFSAVNPKELEGLLYDI